MCLGKPKVPDPQPQIDESRRQFDIEQQRLAEREAAQAAEAERQRALEEERYAQQIAAEEAQRAREAEAARQKQASIDGATTAVNSGFAGFDDKYFQSFTNDYLGYYNPQIQQQAEDARKEAQFELARRGTLDSTAATDVYARLAEKQQQEESRIAREAAAAAQGLRTSVAGARSNLLEQAVNSGGQGDFVSLARDAAGGLKPPEFAPIGDVFAGMIAGPSNGQAGATAGGAGTPAQDAIRRGQEQGARSARTVNTRGRDLGLIPLPTVTGLTY